GLNGIALNGRYLWAWGQGQMTRFTIFGNDLHSESGWSLSDTLTSTLIAGDHLLYLQQQTLWLDGRKLKEFNASPLWLVRHHDNYWIQFESGELQRFTLQSDELSEFTSAGIFPVSQQAVSVAGSLALVTDADQLVILADDLLPEVQSLGYVDLQGISRQQLLLSNGYLYAANGKRWRIGVDADARPSFIDRYKPGGRVSAMDWWMGELYVAADHYGAYRMAYDHGEWHSRHLSSPYAERVAALGHTGHGMWVAKKDLDVVVHLTDPAATQKTRIRGFEPAYMAVSQPYVAVADGGTLHIVSDDDPDSGEVALTLPDNAKVAALTWREDALWVATDNGQLLEYYFSEWPIHPYDVRWYQHDIGLTEPVRQIAAESGRIWLRQESGLQYYTLDDGEVREYSLPDAKHVTQIALSGGLLWVAYETELTAELRAVQLDNLQLEGDFSYETEITALAASSPYLAVGFVDGTVTIEHVSTGIQKASADVVRPGRRNTFAYGEFLDFELSDNTSIAASDISLNENLSYSLPAFGNYSDIVPGWLLNGQSINIRARVQDHYGRIYEGSITRADLQSRDLPGNDMTVSLDFPGISYYPAPLQIEAVLHEASQPVQLVEYYMASAETGPYELIAKHYGPEFIIRRNFGIEKDGYWLKARAVDIYGNFAESAARQIQRQTDVQSPQLNIVLTGEPVVDIDTVISDESFSVISSAADNESGVQSILLYRESELKAAIFDDTILSVNDVANSAGASLNYRVVASDYAGNQSEEMRALTVIENTPPEITSLTINNISISLPDTQGIQIIEGDTLSLTGSVRDDVWLEAASISWLDAEQTLSLQGKQSTLSLKLQDERTVRQQGDESRTLSLRVADRTGRTQEYPVPVLLKKDQQPDISKLIVELPQAAIYGEKASIRLSGIATVDDAGRQQLSCNVLNTSGQVILEFTCMDGTVRVPVAAEDRNLSQFRFQLQVVDRFGQQDISSIYELPVTSRPNQVRFTVNTDVNPAFITPDESPLYQVVLEDDAARGVAAQNITWYIARRNDANNQTYLGRTATSSAGYAEWALNSSLTTGDYVLSAYADSRFGLQPAQSVIHVEAGQLTGVIAEYSQNVIAGGEIQLTLKPSDKAGNIPVNIAAQDVQIRLDSGFHFALDSVGDIATATDGIEVLSFTLEQQPLNLTVSAAETAGNYQFSVDTALTVYYRNDTALTESNQLPVNVRPALADEARIVFIRDQFQLNPGSVKGEIETGDQLSYEVRLFDRFGNQTQDQGLYYRIMEGSNLLLSNYIWYGVSSFSLLFSDAGTHQLSLIFEDQTYRYLNTSFDVQVEQKGPGLLNIIWQPGVSALRPQLIFEFDEAVELPTGREAG
ncbi:MAG: hypothetical protein KKH95_01680, partial [Gammaproteobacteria bacterium]|nr:hypothetical protein [Gammaproteobacteria bacterium]